ncbi:MAG: ABC transporter substrate-binding protein [Gammaproteobacteria bacterium]|nr:ABC transporter substrate-binding protein [Gammaproteobacteria bacterium]
MKKCLLSIAITSGILAVAANPVMASGKIPVGHLATFTGPTSAVGKPYGQGVADAMNYINNNGGIDGMMLDFDTVDYSYNAPRAVSTYKKWKATKKPVAIQGWGTADTEALVKFVAKDKTFFMSASYSAHLTDPTGDSPKTKAAAPYNFFYGPSYSDGCRGVVQWASEDWKSKGGSGSPKFIHMGDNHPYPNAPKESCAAYAKELGFEVLPPIVYSLKPGDFKAQCLSLKDSGANYAYLANTSGSNISLLKSCKTVGVDTQFLSNIWGWDENAMKATGNVGDGLVWVVGAASWNDDVPGMKTVKDISKISDPSASRALHYMRGVCTAFFMRDAMLAANKAGGVNGTNMKNAMEKMTGHVPAGMEGVCTPHTWTGKDHRGSMSVMVYRSVDGSNQKMEKVYTAELPRRAEWLGW